MFLSGLPIDMNKHIGQEQKVRDVHEAHNCTTRQEKNVHVLLVYI